MPTSGSVVIASDGKELQIDSLSPVLAYNASNLLSTITVTAFGNTYVQTYTYNAGGLLTNISVWVRQ